MMQGVQMPRFDGPLDKPTVFLFPSLTKESGLSRLPNPFVHFVRAYFTLRNVNANVYTRIQVAYLR
jgi:hypothetical protein